MGRTKTIETSAGEILFRLPNEADVWEVKGHLPTLARPRGQSLPVLGPGAEDRKSEEAFKGIPLINAMLIRCAKRPRLTDEPHFVSTANTIDIEELTVKERSDIFTELMEAAGHGEREADRIAPLSASAETSSSSTSSGAGTDADRPN